MTPDTKTDDSRKKLKNQDLFLDTAMEKMKKMTLEKESNLYFFASEDALFHFSRAGFTIPYYMSEDDYLRFCVEKTIGNVRKTYSKLHQRIENAETSTEIFRLIVMRLTSNLKNCLKCVKEVDLISPEKDGTEEIENEIEIGKMEKSEIKEAIEKMLKNLEIERSEAEEIVEKYDIELDIEKTSFNILVDNNSQLRMFDSNISEKNKKNYYSYEKRKKARDSKNQQQSLFVA